MRILALDLGTQTGWAFGDTDNLRVYSGVQDFELKRGESPGMKYLYFDRWIYRMMAEHDPKVVAYEMPHMRGGYASQLLMGFLGILLKACAEVGVEFTQVHSATLKKHATGSGRASKEDMIQAANTKFRAQVKDDNEADALHVWDYAKMLVSRRTMVRSGEVKNELV